MGRHQPQPVPADKHWLICEATLGFSMRQKLRIFRSFTWKQKQISSSSWRGMPAGDCTARAEPAGNPHGLHVPLLRLLSGQSHPYGRLHAAPFRRKEHQMNSTARLVLIVILILLLLGMLPVWPYSAGFGYYPVGGLGLVLLIVIVLLLAGKL